MELFRYLEFFHAVPVAMFDAAEYRRKLGFVRIPDLDCPQDNEMRRNTYTLALNDLEAFLLANDNGVGILDASLTTHELRSMVKMRVSFVISLFCCVDFVMRLNKLAVRSSLLR